MKLNNNTEPIPIQQPSPDVFSNQEAERDIVQEEEKEDIVHKSIGVYDNENAKLTKFFSTSSLEDLYDALGCYAGNRILYRSFCYKFLFCKNFE